MNEIETKLAEVIKLAARAGASGSGYVIDIMHSANVEALNKAKAELLAMITAKPLTGLDELAQSSAESIVGWQNTHPTVIFSIQGVKHIILTTATRKGKA